MANKRPGRPNVLKAYCGDNDDLYKSLRQQIPDGSARKKANSFYSIWAGIELSHHADQIDHYELLVPEKGMGKQGVLEQLGRMIYQDGDDMDHVLNVAQWAADELHAGAKSKIIEKVIRSDRMDHRK